MSDNQRCKYLTKAGDQCSRRAIEGYDGCYSHAPEFEPARRAAAKKGGEAGGRGRTAGDSSTDPDAANLKRLAKVFEGLAANVLNGSLDRNKVAVAVQALNGARACHVANAKLRETFEFEARLAALEESMEHSGGRGNIRPV
jgi:hypothetical protein